MHDWTRVPDGIYHDFHLSWVVKLSAALDSGLLSRDYYALTERRSGDIGLDASPPELRGMEEADDLAFYLARRRTIAVRHVSGDRKVALIEMVSPGNKHNQRTVGAFVDEAVAALAGGMHVLLIDPFPPGRHDPNGMHGAIWERLCSSPFHVASETPLTLASHRVRQPVLAHAEPFAVDDKLADMPLSLTPDDYILTPLEATYQQAYRGVPERWRRVIEGRERNRRIRLFFLS